MVWVLPGWEDVLARDFRFRSPLIREDFPTLDFPANATSGHSFSGSLLVMPHTVSSSACLMIIYFLPLKMCLNILNHIEKLKSSRILLTASPCMLLWLQVTHYSQVLVHSTVVNSRNSLRYILTFAFIMQFCKL